MSTPQAPSTSVNVSPTGIGCLGFAGFLTIVLIVLKAVGVLEISWLLALAPVLVVLGGGIVALLLLLLILGVGVAVLTAVKGAGK